MTAPFYLAARAVFFCAAFHTMTKTKQEASACPCGSGLSYEACCGRYIDSGLEAPDACALMRSRYTAYALGNEAYLQKTWADETRPETVLDGPAIKWLGLKVLSFEQTDAEHAVVRFVARGRVATGRAFRLAETSRFENRGGVWIYVDGDVEEN